jgi:hypothetical protein
MGELSTSGGKPDDTLPTNVSTEFALSNTVVKDGVGTIGASGGDRELQANIERLLTCVRHEC